MHNFPTAYPTTVEVMDIIWERVGSVINNMIDLWCGEWLVMDYFDSKWVESYWVDIKDEYILKKNTSYCDLKVFHTIPLDYDLVYMYHPINNWKRFEEFIHNKAPKYVVVLLPQFIPSMNKIIYYKDNLLIYKNI